MGISRVEVVNTTTRAFSIFNIDQYIYSWNSTSNFTKTPSDTCYTVTVDTAALTKAIVFDGEVYLKIHGDKGNTEEMRLQNWWSSSFTPGQDMTFYVTSVNIGAMSAVTVRTVGSGSADKWGLSSLDVINNTTSGHAVFEWGKYIKAGEAIKIEKKNIPIVYEVSHHPGQDIWMIDFAMD